MALGMGVSCRARTRWSPKHYYFPCSRLWHDAKLVQTRSVKPLCPGLFQGRRRVKIQTTLKRRGGVALMQVLTEKARTNKRGGVGAVIILMHPRCYLTHKRPDYEFLPQAELTFALLSSFFLFNLGIAYDTGLQNGGISLDFFFWSTHKRQIFVIDARARAAGSQSVSASVVRLTNW